MLRPNVYNFRFNFGGGAGAEKGLLEIFLQESEE